MPQITHFYTQGPSSAVAISAMPTCWQRPAKMSKGGQLQLVSLMAVKSINCTASKDEELIENSPTLQNAMCFLLTVLFSFSDSYIRGCTVLDSVGQGLHLAGISNLSVDSNVFYNISGHGLLLGKCGRKISIQHVTATCANDHLHENVFGEKDP